jgi:hypothetical protein
VNASNETKRKEDKIVSTVGVRYMIDDVRAAIKFYTTYLGFTPELDASPAFASVSRDGVRLLLSGKPVRAVGRCLMVANLSLADGIGFISRWTISMQR